MGTWDGVHILSYFWVCVKLSIIKKNLDENQNILIKIPVPLCLKPNLAALKYDSGICIFINALVQMILGPHFVVHTWVISFAQLAFMVAIFSTKLLSTGLQSVMPKLMNTCLY